MIGFIDHQGPVRRPIYSVTGQKLCYLVSGPDGEWIQGLDGRNRARITKWQAQPAATQTAAAALTYNTDWIYEE